jgi:hypothetical protein
VAGDVIGTVDQVGGLDRCLAETQVGDGDAARFFGVVGEIRLGVHVGVVADDLDGALVGADGAVGPQAPELALDRAFGATSNPVSTSRLVWVTSSVMPTVKWFLGAMPFMLSNTALTMEGVNSLDPSP